MKSMCLDIDSYSKRVGMRAWKRLVKRNGWVWVWKVYNTMWRERWKPEVHPWWGGGAWVKYGKPRLATTYRRSVVEAGWQSSGRKVGLTGIEKSRKEVDRGVHVMLGERAARQLAVLRKGVAVRVKARVKDLVAVGYFSAATAGSSAVFTKVWLSKEDYEKALKEGAR